MEKLSPHLNKESLDNRGINIVDLMMWLVIAALLLAAAIQSIGYYQQATKVYLMQDEVTGVVARVHAASAIDGESLSKELVAKVLEEHNNAHPNDDTVISYGTVPANAVAAPSTRDSGFSLASVVAAASPTDIIYLQADSESVDNSYVVYFFKDTARFKQGITVVRKDSVVGEGEVVTPGAPAIPADEPTATPSPTPTTTTDPVIVPEESSPTPTPTPTPVVTETTPAPVVTPTPTPTATATVTPPPPVVTGPSITSSSDIVAFDSAGALWNYRSASAADGRISIGAAGAAIPDDFYVTDWNGDGIMDLLIKGKDGTLTLRKGNATGGFTNQGLGTSGWQNLDITVGKFKKTDLYPSIIGKDRTTGYLYNYTNPDGSWIKDKNQIGTGWSSLSPLNLIDWDQDGSKDVIARNANGELVLYRTNGAGAFIMETRQIIGAGWGMYDSIHVMTGRGGAGKVGLMARSATVGNLAYYEATKNAWLNAVHVSNGWTGFKIAGN